MSDPYDLERFMAAQEGVYDVALAELRSGRKRSHWMWFIFPQLAGLGSSAMAQRYAITSIEETKAYLAHPVLGPRLIECARATLRIQGKTADEIFGTPDDLKLRSCATLFSQVSAENSVFHQIISCYFDDKSDLRTLELLQTEQGR